MKTINLELSKRLAPYLEDRETEYIYGHIQGTDSILKTDNGLDEYKYICKTLDLEEAIEFIKDNNKLDFRLTTDYGKYLIISDENHFFFNGKTLLEVIEKMLEYLLDNNLLEQYHREGGVTKNLI